jgi:hypothetical protein
MPAGTSPQRFVRARRAGSRRRASARFKLPPSWPDGWLALFLACDRLAGQVPDPTRMHAAAGRGNTPLTVAAGPMTVAENFDILVLQLMGASAL